MIPALTARWRRALIWGGVVFAILTIINTFGVSVWFVLVRGRNLTDEPDPSLWKLPVALKDVAISTAPGTKLSYLGYEFEVPWSDLDEEKTKGKGEYQVVAFHSGKSMIFHTSPPDEILNGSPGEKSVDRKALVRFFGEETVESDYAFERTALDTTPGQISLFTPQGEAERKILLLFEKSVDVVANSGESGVFLVETHGFRGFQYGNPASHPPAVDVDLFGSKDRMHFVFRDKKGGGGISQPEINRVIQSVRPVLNR